MRQPIQPPNWQYGQVSIIRKPPNVRENIGLPVVSTNPNGNTWNTIHDPPVVGSFRISRSVDIVTYNGYNVAPPSSGAVNNTNIPYAQQLPITTTGGPMYNYSNQNMYSQPQNSFTQNQTVYPQPSVHVLLQNYNMQAPGNQIVEVTR